jgi:surface antigen
MHKRIWGVAAIAAPLLAGCAGGSSRDDVAYNDMPSEPGHATVEDSGSAPLECVPYARDHSGVKIYGDAYTWWGKAADKYQRAATPQMGAVMVLSGYAGADRGHVAVVEQVISPREIRVDHANWLDDGSVYLNDPVADVSAENDWSQVRVFNLKTRAWGGHIYPVQGFILSPAGAPDSDAPPLAILTAHVQRPVTKPQTEPSQTVQPIEPHDLTPEDRELAPASMGPPGAIALAEPFEKAR